MLNLINSNGISYTYEFDAHGNLKIERRIGNDETIHTLREAQYDTAGEQIQNVQGLLTETISYGYNTANGSKFTKTNWFSDGQTNFTLYYKDGTIAKRYGDGAPSVEYMWHLRGIASLPLGIVKKIHNDYTWHALPIEWKPDLDFTNITALGTNWLLSEDFLNVSKPSDIPGVFYLNLEKRLLVFGIKTI